MKNFKKLFYLLLLFPLLVISQNTKEYFVFENVMLTVKPDKIKQFEKGIAAHNIKFHSDNVYGARVYLVMETFLGCGTGFCLGCVIPLKNGGYAHLCKEGPTLLAEEIDLNAI